MKLWIDGKPGSAGSAIRATVKSQVADINRQVVSRGVRAVNALRNAELEVLKGQRSGKVYRKPYTYGKPTKATKELMGDYGHRLRGGNYIGHQLRENRRPDVQEISACTGMDR